MENHWNKIFTKLIILLFFFPLFVSAQAPNTLVMGAIKNNLAQYIELQVNQKYLNDAVDLYKSNILEDGTFMFAVEVNEPQFAKIIYARNEALIYLEPHDTLVINSAANSFQYSLIFSGKGGVNNTFTAQYLKDNPPIMNSWELLQYQKGIFWFANEVDVDQQMQQMGESQFTMAMSRKKENAMSKLLRFQNQTTGVLSPDFIAFIETDIYYDWAYHLLLYGSVYNNMHQLDEATFFNFLKDIPLHDKQIGSYWYRNFLLAYINYMSIQEKKEGDEYVNQYLLADRLLQSKQQAFVKAHLIYKGFYAKRADAIIPYYIDFIEHNPYPIYDEKVTGAYQKSMRYAIGAPAPDFSVTNMQNEEVDLLDFQGKVVFLNFWASWCRPCVNKMYQLKPMQKELEEQQIVFLNISLDSDQSSWINSVQTNGFEGVHTMAEGSLNSDVSTSYEVKALPQYFIIDKHGNFAEKPLTKGIDALKSTLVYLNRRK
ncbi:MAG: thiol-disulfide isomerase/thioredoxin [Saprospiraceae bacterium]|jgi:thiol-disulfide isomerase/thioredoxin